LRTAGDLSAFCQALGFAFSPSVWRRARYNLFFFAESDFFLGAMETGFLAGALTLGLAACAVGIHHSALAYLSRRVPAVLSKRRVLIAAVIGALFAHILEILLFGFGYYLAQAADLGELRHFADDAPRREWRDCVYFSFVTYTTLGYGDIFPAGALRFLAGVEAITGLVLITWTASFLFRESVVKKAADY
jgi:hypothetical protein